MKLIYSEDHRSHAGAKEMRDDQMIPMIECPERMDVIMGALMQAGFTDIVAPNSHGPEVVHQVHDPAIVSFLPRCYPLWEAEFGPGRFATAYTFGRRGMDKMPTGSVYCRPQVEDPFLMGYDPELREGAGQSV